MCLDAVTAEDDPASTDGDASDIDINEDTETALENKVDEHNEEAPESKQVTLGMLKKVYRRGAGAWFSSNAGATQQQWAFARVNAFLEDLMADRPLNSGNDNDLAPDGYDAAEAAAHLAPENGVVFRNVGGDPFTDQQALESFLNDVSEAADGPVSIGDTEWPSDEYSIHDHSVRAAGISVDEATRVIENHKEDVVALTGPTSGAFSTGPKGLKTRAATTIGSCSACKSRRARAGFGDTASRCHTTPRTPRPLLFKTG